MLRLSRLACRESRSRGIATRKQLSRWLLANSLACSQSSHVAQGCTQPCTQYTKGGLATRSNCVGSQTGCDQRFPRASQAATAKGTPRLYTHHQCPDENHSVHRCLSGKWLLVLAATSSYTTHSFQEVAHVHQACRIVAYTVAVLSRLLVA